MASFNLTDVTNLFKIKYGKLSENTYNSANVLLGRVKKTYDFTGKQKTMASPTSFAGGVGSGSLPTANTNTVEDPTIVAKKVYARALIDRESIKASSNDEGAFVRATKFVVQRAVESYMRNASRILFNNSAGSANGAIAVGDNATNVSGAGTTGSPYVVVLGADTVEAFVEEKDYWNYDAETTNLEVVDYVPSTKSVSLVGTSVGLAALTGSGPVPNTKYFYMQGSSANDPTGLGEVLNASSGTLYGVNVARRWQASTQEDAAGAGLTTDMMNQDILEIDRKSGKVPNLVICSYTQFRKLLNIVEDKKYITVDPRYKPEGIKGNIGWSGLEYMSSAGPIPVIPERFMKGDEMWYLNDNFIEICHRPDFGWFDDDGTIFLRTADSDEYEARYGGYWEMYSTPVYHGIRSGLAE